MPVDPAVSRQTLDDVFRILYRLIVGLARLAAWTGRAKDLEIMVLRHQLTVLRRNTKPPRLSDLTALTRYRDNPLQRPRPRIPTSRITGRMEFSAPTGVRPTGICPMRRNTPPSLSRNAGSTRTADISAPTAPPVRSWRGDRS